MPEDISEDKSGDARVCVDTAQLPILSQVTSKKTGYPGVGLVIGHIVGEFYRVTTERSVEAFCLWNKLYPDWRYKNVVYVRYSEQRKNMTLNELRFSLKNNPETSENDYTEQEIQDMYANLREVRTAAYPIDDLEIFEDANEVKLEEGEEPQLGLQEKEKE